MSEPRVHPERGSARDAWIGLAVLVSAGLLAWLSWIAIDGSPFSHAYRVRVTLPADGPVLRPGADVRVGGERAGQVRSVHLRDGQVAEATLELDRSRAGRGAAAIVRPRGLAGSVYVELHPGDPRQPLPSGALLGRARAAVQLNDVVTGFDSAARRALARVAATGGAGVAARGPRLNTAVADLPPLLDDARAVLDAVRPAPGALHDAVAAGGGVLRAAGAPSGAVAAAVRGARDVFEPVGERSAAVRDVLAQAPAVETAARGFATDAAPLLRAAALAARRLAPASAGLERALPSLVGAERADAGIDTFAATAVQATPSLRAAGPVLQDAEGPAAGLVPFAAPLATFARGLLPYGTELREAPLGFTRWGDFRYDFGQAPGHRAVRFSMVFTCARARDPYPAPGAAAKERERCG